MATEKIAKDLARNTAQAEIVTRKTHANHQAFDARRMVEHRNGIRRETQKTGAALLDRRRFRAGKQVAKLLDDLLEAGKRRLDDRPWPILRLRDSNGGPTYGIAISELKTEGKCRRELVHRQVRYLSNFIEDDHSKLKQLIKPVRGFTTFKTAYATIRGFEVMRALRKGQAAIFNLTGDVRGEAGIVKRAFGTGTSAWTEAVALPAQSLESREVASHQRPDQRSL